MFIEVTTVTKHFKVKKMLNINKIVSVNSSMFKDNSGETLIHFREETNKEIRYMTVVESYEEIKGKIEHAMGKDVF